MLIERMGSLISHCTWQCSCNSIENRDASFYRHGRGGACDVPAVGELDVNCEGGLQRQVFRYVVQSEQWIKEDLIETH